MPAPQSTESLLEIVRKSGLIKIAILETYLQAALPSPDLEQTLAALVKADLLTPFQARFMLQGSHKGLILGPYKILRTLTCGLPPFPEKTAYQILMAHQLDNAALLSKLCPTVPLVAVQSVRADAARHRIG